MDEKLKQVLQRVELLCTQNPEFRNELIKKLEIPISYPAIPPVSNTTAADERITKIETYLGLDYKLDTIMPSNTIYNSIDYSFIGISAVRDKLNSDFREMMRYRFGTRLHKVDFYEFCKYAHYQLEALVNEFLTSYSLKEDSENDEIDIEITKQFIIDNWPTWKTYQPNFTESTREIQQISYDTKISSIMNYLKIDRINISKAPYILYSFSDVVSNIRNIRNDISHRSAKQEELIEKTINKFEKNAHIGKSNLYIFDDNKVKDYLWRRQTPFDDVIKVIAILCNSIKSQLV